MLNAKTMDAKFLSTLIGAGFGASALEGDGDLVGATIGLGVGAFAGSQMNLDLPKTDRYLQRNQTIRINNKPVAEIEKIRSELLEKITKQPATGFDFLESNNISFDKDDPFRTLSNNNLKDVIKESSDLSELKTVSSILKSGNDFEKMDISDLRTELKPKQQIVRSVANDSVENKKNLVKRYFQDMGYSGKELEEKLNVFEPNLKTSSSLVINKDTNKMTIDGSEFRITSNNGPGNISSHSDGSNFSAVRKVNPFADMYTKSMDGRAVAQALGINFADAAKEDAIAGQIEEYMKHGAKPEDLKALLSQSDSFTSEALDSFIEKSYQHREMESGHIALGQSQSYVEQNVATRQSQNISNQTSLHQVFRTNRDGSINAKEPFRGFSAVSYNDDGSELQHYKAKLSEELGKYNLQEDIKSDHTHLVNTGGSGAGGRNTLAPPERNPSTTGSRTNPVAIANTPVNKVVGSFDTLRNKGMIAGEYSTSAAFSRMTVDKDQFNLVSNFYTDKAIISLGDGSALGKRSVRAEYSHKGFKKYDVASKGTSNSFTLSSNLTENIKARESLGVTLDAPEIKAEGYSQDLKKLESFKQRQSDLISTKVQTSKSTDLNTTVPFRNTSKEQLEGKQKFYAKKIKDYTQSVNSKAKAAKEEVISAMGGLKQGSEDHKALYLILNSMNTDLNQGAEDFQAYKKVTEQRFKPGEVIGINPNGLEVKLSEEFKDYKLVKSLRSFDENSTATSSFIFEGFSNLGQDSIVKDFGVDSKESIKNLTDDWFNKSYGIASFLNKTGYEAVLENDQLVFNTHVKDADGNNIFKSFAEVKGDLDIESAKASNSGVSIISDTSGGGQKLSTQISEILDGTAMHKHMITDLGETVARPMVFDDVGLHSELKGRLKTIAEDIPNQVAKMNLETPEDVVKATRARNWALGQLANSLTEGKASASSVEGLAILGLKNVRDLTNTVLADPSGSSKESRYASTILKDTLGVDYNSSSSNADFITNAEDSFLRKTEQVQSMFTAQNLAKSLSVDPSTPNAVPAMYDKNTLDVYNLAYNRSKESTHIASPDISSPMRTGSGKMGKDLSHTAQLQLKLSGYTSEDMEWIGKHSAEAVYDLKFSTELSSTSVNYEDTINSFLDTKDPKYKASFLQDIAKREPEMINDFLIAEGVPQNIIDQDFLNYAPENKNSQGITNIPIHKHSTSTVGMHILDNGKVVSRTLKNSVSSFIATDQDASRLGVAYIENHDQAALQLADKVKDIFLSKNNPQMKKTLALQTENSVYSLVKHASSIEFDAVVEKYSKTGHNVVGFTQATALQNLRGQGIDVTKETLHNFIDSDGILLTQLTDGTKRQNISLQNREPTLSDGSIRHTLGYVFPKGVLGESDKLGVYHSDKDQHYKNLMFGDFDQDHTTVYDSNRKMTPEAYERRLNHANVFAQGKDELIALNKDLQIKRTSETVRGEIPAHTMYDLIEQVDGDLDNLGIKKGSPEYYAHVVEAQEKRLQLGATKGSARKSVSPGVTQLAVGLAENTFQSQKLDGEDITLFDKRIMRTMGHSLVENLLKTQHLDTNSFKAGEVLPVEKLLNARSALATAHTQENVDTYSKLYRSQIKSLFQTPEMFKKYEKHAEAMLEADIRYIKDPRLAPSNAMHVSANGSKIREMPLDHMGEMAKAIASGSNSTGIESLPMDLGDINIERSFKVGYNDLLSSAKQNIIKNKFPLMVGGGGLALGALLTQDEPNFKPSKRARADTGSMMLAPNVVSQEQSKQSDPMMLQSMGRTATDYIAPEGDLRDIGRSIKKTIRIQGSYDHIEQDINHSMKEAIFGNNISNVRISREYD